jgi:negative regulator of sigma E activity
MNDETLDERLSAYLDGELSPAERGEVEALLRERPELAQAVEEMRQIGEGIRELPRLRLSTAFADRVVAAASAAERERAGALTPRRRIPLVAALAAVAAVAVTILAIIFIRAGGEQEPIAQPPALSPSEQAVAKALDAGAGAGIAVVVRLRLTRDDIRSKRLDEALRSAGIALAPASASNPAAQQAAQSYKALASQQPLAASAGDVVFVEAPRDKLIQALAALANTPDPSEVIAAEAVIPSAAPGPKDSSKAEGEGGSQGAKSPPLDAGNYAQHLPPRGMPLLKSRSFEFPPPAQKPASSQPTRVLIVVEAAD